MVWAIEAREDVASPNMTLDQVLAFAVILGTIALLIWDRVRYDLVALLALLASVACGIVPAAQAFRGFSSDIVIIIGSALVVSAAIGRSGLIETLMKPFVPKMTTSGMQVAVLASAVTALSAFIKNIGAVAIFIPIALQVARKTEKPPSRVLMPLAFGSLLGGLITLIGTSPNIIVSQMREQITGEPFRMFDFAPVAICLAVAGVAFLTVGWRLLPRIKKGAGATPETRFSIEDYITEVRLPASSPCIGKTVRELEALGDGGVTVAAIVREGYRRYIPAGYWPLFEGDILVLEADTHALSRLVDDARLELIHGKRLASDEAPQEDLAVIEAVVTANSIMIGNTVEQLALRERYGLNLLAMSRSGEQDRPAAAPGPLPGGRSAGAAGPRRAHQRQACLSRLPASGRAQRTLGPSAQPLFAGGDPRGRDGSGHDGHRIGADRLPRCRGSDAGAAVADAQGSVRGRRVAGLILFGALIR